MMIKTFLFDRLVVNVINISINNKKKLFSAVNELLLLLYTHKYILL